MAHLPLKYIAEASEHAEHQCSDQHENGGATETNTPERAERTRGSLPEIRPETHNTCAEFIEESPEKTDKIEE